MPKIDLPFGPYHPALGEPEYFQIITDGEIIEMVDFDLGYNYREMEKKVLTFSWPKAARETLSELLTVQSFDVVVQPSTFRAVSSLARNPSDVVIIGLDDLFNSSSLTVKIRSARTRSQCLIKR